MLASRMGCEGMREAAAGGPAPLPLSSHKIQHMGRGIVADGVRLNKSLMKTDSTTHGMRPFLPLTSCHVCLALRSHISRKNGWYSAYCPLAVHAIAGNRVRAC
eukprot:scaffold41201_cov18-Tisochrysis_lutea.AAC.1